MNSFSCCSSVESMPSQTGTGEPRTRKEAFKKEERKRVRGKEKRERKKESKESSEEISHGYTKKEKRDTFVGGGDGLLGTLDAVWLVAGRARDVRGLPFGFQRRGSTRGDREDGMDGYKQRDNLSFNVKSSNFAFKIPCATFLETSNSVSVVQNAARNLKPGICAHQT